MCSIYFNKHQNFWCIFISVGSELTWQKKIYHLFSDDSPTVSSLCIFYWHLFLNQNEACVFFKMSWPSCLWTFAHAVLSLLECTSHLGVNKEIQRTKFREFSFSSLGFSVLSHSSFLVCPLCYYSKSVKGNLATIVGSLALVLSKPSRVVVLTTCHKLFPLKNAIHLLIYVCVCICMPWKAEDNF